MPRILRYAATWPWLGLMLGCGVCELIAVVAAPLGIALWCARAPRLFLGGLLRPLLALRRGQPKSTRTHSAS